jgi:hypothetical protein
MDKKKTSLTPVPANVVEKQEPVVDKKTKAEHDAILEAYNVYRAVHDASTKDARDMFAETIRSRRNASRSAEEKDFAERFGGKSFIVTKTARGLQKGTSVTLLKRTSGGQHWLASTTSGDIVTVEDLNLDDAQRAWLVSVQTPKKA